jgi:hypothetical protein
MGKLRVVCTFFVFVFHFLVDTQQGQCYTRLTSSEDCSDPLPMKLSKKDCCCGKDMGKGWGSTCEHCPLQGMGKLYNIMSVK